MTQRIQLFDLKFPPVFHYQKVTDHSLSLPHFLLLNAESKSSSRTDQIHHYDCHVKFKNNTSGCAQLWDTACKFLCPGLSITSPDHLGVLRDTRRLLFLTSALEVPILHICPYPKPILSITRLFHIVSISAEDTISVSSAMHVHHVGIKNSQPSNIVSYTLAEPFLFQPDLLNV